MSARSTGQKARILGPFTVQLDRLIPEDESVPLKWATLAGVEERVETLARAELPHVLRN